MGSCDYLTKCFKAEKKYDVIVKVPMALQKQKKGHTEKHHKA